MAAALRPYLRARGQTSDSAIWQRIASLHGTSQTTSALTEGRQLPDPSPAGHVLLEPRARITPGIRLLGIYAVVRVALLAADAFAAHVSYSSNLAGPLHSWDSNWYLLIATHGLPAIAPMAGGQLTFGAAGFLPVFPLLIRLVVTLGLSPVGATLFVSIVAGAIATLVVWRLAAALAGEDVAWRAAVLFMVFPGMAIAWGLLYSECVGLALVAGSLLLILREKWVWAGVVGALATATSPSALPLVLAAAAPAVQALRRHEVPGALLTMLVVPTGFLVYVAALAFRYHDVLFWWHLQTQAWGASVDFGRSLLALLPHLWRIGYQGPAWLEWIGLVAVAGAVAALWRARLPASINAYCAGVLVLLFVSSNLGFKPRLLTWAFPALIAVAAATRPRTWLAVVIAFACLLPLVFVVYTTLGDSMAQP